jgi:hypothetical protein
MHVYIIVNKEEKENGKKLRLFRFCSNDVGSYIG